MLHIVAPPHTLVCMFSLYKYNFNVCVCVSVWNALELIEMGKADNNNETKATKSANKNKNSKVDEEKKRKKQTRRIKQMCKSSLIIKFLSIYEAVAVRSAPPLCDKETINLCTLSST